MNNIEVDTELLFLQSLLNVVGDTSYAYKTLRNRYPINNLTQSEKSTLIDSYRAFLDQLVVVLKKYK